jgi:16S rRNA (guanine527-N7)-methyltransferase
MTEEEAHDWIARKFGVSRETLLAKFAALLGAEMQRQNLISASSFDQLWSRHFVDSAQLIHLAEGAQDGEWLDVGTGAGMPGLIVALLVDRPVRLVEPRNRRVEFLRNCAEDLGVTPRVTVEQKMIEKYRPAAPAAVISARAVSQLSQLIQSTHHCADKSTIWVLPKGQSAQSEVEAARHSWQGSFHVEPSITGPASGIVVARGVQPK